MAPAIAIRTVEPADWPAVERLFGSKGACGGCWCMYWHAPVAGQPWERTKGDTNRQALKDGIGAGDCPSVLLMDGACCAPRRGSIACSARRA